MLINAFGTIVKNLFKNFFIEKEKKTINVLISFFIFYKSVIKIFLKWIINYFSKNTR